MDIEAILELLHLVCIFSGISAIVTAAVGAVLMIRTPPKQLKKQIYEIKNPPPPKPIKRIVQCLITAEEHEQMKKFLKELEMDQPQGWITPPTKQEREA